MLSSLLFEDLIYELIAELDTWSVVGYVATDLLRGQCAKKSIPAPPSPLPDSDISFDSFCLMIISSIYIIFLLIIIG